MRATIRFALSVVLAVAIVVPVYGQRGRRPSTASQVPRYVPSTPTVSPYVNLLNRNNNFASNYFGLVRPQQRQQIFNQQQSQLANIQERELQSLRSQQEAFEQPDVRPTGTASWFQTQDNPQRFQQPSHFFGQWENRGGQQRRGAPQRR